MLLVPNPETHHISKFLSLDDKESAIVSAFIPVHASGKQGGIKTAQDSLTRCAHDAAN